MAEQNFCKALHTFLSAVSFQKEAADKIISPSPLSLPLSSKSCRRWSTAHHTAPFIFLLIIIGRVLLC